MVVGLEYHDPLFDPHEAFQKFKTHPFVQQDSRRRQAGPLRREDGSVRRLVFDAAHLRGRRPDHRRFRQPAEFAAAEGNSHRDQKRHARRGNDLRSALRRRHFRENALRLSAENRSELDQKRTVGSPQFSPGISRRLVVRTGARRIAIRHRRSRPHRSDAQRSRATQEYAKLHRDRTLVDQSTRFKGDGKLTFDRLTDVYHSGTRHDEDQPCHLVVLDPNICGDRCVREYGNPCQYFCPAAVYEMVDRKRASRN